MGILDRLFGRKTEPSPTGSMAGRLGGAGQQAPLSDEQAIERYRYMLQTAPPAAVEQAHEEAFAKLTPSQRAQVLRELTAVTPEPERAALGDRDDPKTLARLATRAELRQPGVMERTLGGPSMGGMMAGTLFSSLAGAFVGTMIAQQFFQGAGFDQASLGEQLAVDQPADAASGDVADGGGFGADFGGDIGGDI